MRFVLIIHESVCGNPASASKNFLAFAGTPQVSRETFWCLRESRKPLEKLFGVCGSPASASKNFLVFVGVPQASRETFWRLRELRECLEKLFGVCGSPASLSGNFLVFAGTPQAPFFPFGHLQKFCKLHFLLLGICRSPASLLVWRKPKEGSGKNDRVLGDKCIGSNGFASAKKRQSVGIDEDGA